MNKIVEVRADEGRYKEGLCAKQFFEVGSVQDNLRLLSSRISERFRKFHLAFRFFDLKSSGFIT